MLNYDFRTYIAEGTEFYGMSIKNPDTQEYHERKAPFPGSLLGFLDLDTESLAPLLKKISDELWPLTLTQDKRFAQEALSELAELEERHIYFSYLRLDWTRRTGESGITAYGKKQLLTFTSEVRSSVCQKTQIQHFFRRHARRKKSLLSHKCRLRRRAGRQQGKIPEFCEIQGFFPHVPLVGKSPSGLFRQPELLTSTSAVRSF